jgi:hypothetical protein
MSRIKELAIEIDELEIKSNALLEKSGNLRVERDQLITQEIFDKQLLVSTSWNLKLDINDKVELISKREQGDDGRKCFQTIAKLINVDIHAWDIILDMGNGIELWIEGHADKQERNDPTYVDDFTLRFTENKVAVNFIKKNKLDVDITGVAGRLDELKRSVSTLEIICHQFSAIAL